MKSAVGFLDKEEEDEHAYYHDNGTDKENIGEGFKLLESSLAARYVKDKSYNSTGDHSDESAQTAHEVDNRIALAAKLGRCQVRHERDNRRAPQRHDKDEKDNAHHG